MQQTQSSSTVQVLSPTLHLYHYVLRNSINESSETLQKRREIFSQHLQQFTSQLTIKSGKKADKVVKLITQKEEATVRGNILDLKDIPDDCKPTNGENYDLLYLDGGTVSRRLAVSRLNDTYFLRFTSFISSKYSQQDIDRFGDLPDIINLPLELGQTVILAGIIPKSNYLDANILTIAAKCLSCYYRTQIEPEKLIEYEFLGSPFCIYQKSVTVQKIDEDAIQSIQLSCVFIYKDEATENQANAVYRIFQDLLLSYHKINFFYSQSQVLKKRLNELYEDIERLTEKYHKQKWDSESLKKLPQDSLEYYKKLSFLADQARAIKINFINYKESLKQIEEELGEKAPKFFTEFEKDTVFYIDQIKSNIGFLSPGIKLFEKLMLSVQTQVSIDDEKIQKQQSDQQQQLGQLLTGSCAAIAIGQILAPAITTSISQNYIDKDNSAQPSVSSLWLGAFLTIILSILSGWLVSSWVYQWFTNQED